MKPGNLNNPVSMVSIFINPSVYFEVIVMRYLQIVSQCRLVKELGY